MTTKKNAGKLLAISIAMRIGGDVLVIYPSIKTVLSI